MIRATAAPDETTSRLAAMLTAMLHAEKKPGATAAAAEAPVATASAWKRNRMGVR
ncbi:hypothetical protein [Hymenobacter lutimineralis]|uniref:hypothetical protein n=1 Tax=Hymenobacter lutimineralis TaxID=2606448 RepID=UPI00165603A8|nr:hypothetical protein [Hymenobacter lutimineralis]